MAEFEVVQQLTAGAHLHPSPPTRGHSLVCVISQRPLVGLNLRQIPGAPPSLSVSALLMFNLPSGRERKCILALLLLHTRFLRERAIRFDSAATFARELFASLARYRLRLVLNISARWTVL